jgi:LmbE family N-acetylglucosaminyl deacetylase
VIGTILAISPHLDDAAFSCGGTLARLAAGGWRVVVATAFTRSVPNPTGFALACQLDKGLGPEIDYMALRREEDRAAMRALGAEPPVWLDLPEAPHRGYETVAALFGEVRPEDEAILPPLTSRLREIAEEVRPALVLGPQAVGGHVDHVQVVRALRRVAPPILWWRDFPYTVREAQPKRPFADVLDPLRELSAPLGRRHAAAKREGCRAYRSQLGFQFGGEAGLDAHLEAEGGLERFRIEGPLPAELHLTAAAA